MRTVIYARFSSQLQNSQSIEQQIAACQQRAEREGWEIIEIYTDYAISGAAGVREDQRPGLAAMLTRVEQRDIEQVLIDTTSRIARNQGDAHHIRDRIIFYGARLFTLADGEVDRFKGAIKGLLDEQQRVELRHNIKRGQTGTVKQGRSPAGIAYGYKMANRIDEGSGRAIRGLRVIDDEQAEVVRRIFRAYADGKSPVQIAQLLNAEKIPGPRGQHWRATTLRPDRTRGNGMLQNQLYIGQLVHNRTSKFIEPVSRTVRIRPNPPEEWVRESVPDLRIVDDELWQRVQIELEANRHTVSRPTKKRRPRHLFSGIGVCGECGGGWNIKTADLWGCGQRSEGNGCTNNRLITTDQYQRRALAALQETLLDPDLVAIFVKEYHEEYTRRAIETRRELAILNRRLSENERKIERLVAAIEAGADIEEVRDALGKARADRAGARERMAEIEALPVVALHPTIVDDYRRQVRDLVAQDASSDIRNLIDQIVLTPKPKGRGVVVEVLGRLTAIVALALGTPIAVSATPTVSVERVKGTDRDSRWLRGKG